MTAAEIESAIRLVAPDFCRRNGIRSLRLFGSVLHGKVNPNSDVDLLVEFEPAQRTGFFELSRMQLELTDLLGRTVDLRTPAELSRYFRHNVASEAKYVYGG